MKLLSLLTIVFLSVGVQAADAKKIQRKPNSININIPPACLTEDTQVADSTKMGDDCSKLADQIHTSLMEQIKSGTMGQQEAQEAFDYEVKIRQVSNAYYLTAMKKVAAKVGVGK